MAPGSFRRGFVALVAMLLSASSVAAAETPKRGGVLRVGNLGEPPALDAHWTTASITETLTNHVYEGPLQPRREQSADPDARGEPHGQQGRPHLHLQAPAGHQVPQRQGDDF